MLGCTEAEVSSCLSFPCQLRPSPSLEMPQTNSSCNIFGISSSFTALSQEMRKAPKLEKQKREWSLGSLLWTLVTFGTKKSACHLHFPPMWRVSGGPGGCGSSSVGRAGRRESRQRLLRLLGNGSRFLIKANCEFPGAPSAFVRLLLGAHYSVCVWF